MKLSDKSHLLKYLFILCAFIIAVGSLAISHKLVQDLSQEEKLKIELWAEATQLVANENDDSDMNLVLQILSSNTTIPVILCDDNNNVISSANIEVTSNDTASYLKNKVREFQRKRNPIIINSDSFRQYVYYDDSYTLKNLTLYPYVQIGVVTIFILTSFLAFLSTKKAEQNKVWVGLSKETAHQLGTPISSLIAWSEYLKEKGTDPSIISEMTKDLDRLQVVTERFSKIGSTPTPKTVEFKEALTQSIKYLRNRISPKVIFTLEFPEAELFLKINEPLFGWVIENLTKNAVDAMSGVGNIKFTITQNGNKVYLDISDTGKGIAKSKFKTIFKTGYTTKSRGWGLGLSLSKRIIESYHKGKIFVKTSEIGVGTTFRIELYTV